MEGRRQLYDVVVAGRLNEDAAWYCANPKDAAKNIKEHIAFWRVVTVEAGR
jgi:uncharacterized protein (DUF427 family)